MKGNQLPEIIVDNPNTIIIERNQSTIQLQAQTLSQQPPIQESNEMENYINKELGKDKKQFIHLPLNGMEDLICPLVKLKRKEKNGIDQSITLQDRLCHYLQRKFFKQDNVILISFIFPSIKLIQASLAQSAFTIAEVTNNPNESEKEFDCNIQQLRNQYKSIYKFAENVQSKEKMPDLIFSQNNKFHNYNIPNCILICPYLNSSEFNPSLPQESLLAFILEKLTQIIETNPEKLESVVLLLPGSISLETFTKILLFENCNFYQNFENLKWIQKVSNCVHYKPQQSKRATSNFQKSALSRMSKSGRIRTAQNLEFQLPFRNFIKYTKCTALYHEGTLQYIMVRFKNQKMITQSVSLQSSDRLDVKSYSPIEFDIQKFRKKKQDLQLWLLKQIFFADELFKSTNYQESDYESLTEVLNDSSFIGVSQCLYQLRQDKLISLHSLKKEEYYLKYLSILIGAGVIQNDSDLCLVQSIMQVLGDISPLEITIKKQSYHNLVVGQKETSPSQSDDLAGFSYQFEGEIISDYGLMVYDPEDDQDTESQFVMTQSREIGKSSKIIPVIRQNTDIDNSQYQRNKSRNDDDLKQSRNPSLWLKQSK